MIAALFVVQLLAFLGPRDTSAQSVASKVLAADAVGRYGTSCELRSPGGQKAWAAENGRPEKTCRQVVATFDLPDTPETDVHNVGIEVHSASEKGAAARVDATVRAARVTVDGAEHEIRTEQVVVHLVRHDGDWRVDQVERPEAA